MVERGTHKPQTMVRFHSSTQNKIGRNFSTYGGGYFSISLRSIRKSLSNPARRQAVVSLAAQKEKSLPLK